METVRPGGQIWEPTCKQLGILEGEGGTDGGAKTNKLTETFSWAAKKKKKIYLEIEKTKGYTQ